MRIKCRAKVSKACYDGRPEEEIYGEDGQEDDGSWNGSSVVCDSCYIALGTPNSADLEAAIAQARREGQ